MSEIGNKIEEVTASVKEYVNIQYQAALLKMGGKASTIAAQLLAIGILALIMTLIVAFIGVAFGFYFAEITGSKVEGFSIVAIAYFVIGLLLFIFRERLIVGPVRDVLIKQMFKENGKQEN